MRVVKVGQRWLNLDRMTTAADGVDHQVGTATHRGVAVYFANVVLPAQSKTATSPSWAFFFGDEAQEMRAILDSLAGLGATAAGGRDVTAAAEHLADQRD